MKWLSVLPDVFSIIIGFDVLGVSRHKGMFVFYPQFNYTRKIHVII